MASPTSAGAGSRPVLFVAREPDETLRTFLPVIDRLQAANQRACVVLFHHPPSAWARAQLASRGVTIDEVALPATVLPGGLARAPGARTVDEVARLWRAHSLARAALARHRPSAVVVIQDTLLLERFLVREANRRGLPTLVVQWAFTFPQTMYDRLRTIQHGRTQQATRRSRPRQLLASLTSRAYRSTLRALGLGFDLANSYGGGEARLFAVMGEAFDEQFRSQGIRGKRIVVSGHPTHDAVFQRARSIDAAERARIRADYGLPADRTIVLYATQPVLWRKVISRETLERNVRAIAAAVAKRPGCDLVLKLHPREDAADYAFCATLDPSVRVVEQAEMPDLIAACDLFVSSSSSTVLLAMMLDRPIITVNFDAVPHFDQFEPIGGTLHVRTHADFAAGLDRLLDDPASNLEFRKRRAEVVARYTRFDGHATERIANLVIEAIGESGPRSEPARVGTSGPAVEVRA
jgi:hypothetical protein